MSRPFRSKHKSNCLPTFEALEGRELLSSASGSSYSYQVAAVRHDDHVYVGELRSLELNSKATPAEFLALRDDARAIAAATPPASNPRLVSDAAIAATLQFDRAPLEGWVRDGGWLVIVGRVATSLSQLGTPQPLIDQTEAAMKAVAGSAEVSYADYASLSGAYDLLKNAETRLSQVDGHSHPLGTPHFPDPGVYYTQHLRGFFRGLRAQKEDSRATLRSDLKSIPAESSASASDRAALNRDAGLLVRLGSKVPSGAFAQLGDAFSAMFAGGPPADTELSALKTYFASALGPSGYAAHFQMIDTLLADAPAFYRATGSSALKVQLIVSDIQDFLDNGGASTLNSFLVPLPGVARAAQNLETLRVL